MELTQDSVRMMLFHVPPPGSWADRANCRGKDPDIFFVPRGDRAAEARMLCRECDVREECLDYALTYPGLVGIWAGTNVRERRGLDSRQRNKQESRPSL